MKNIRIALKMAIGIGIILLLVVVNGILSSTSMNTIEAQTALTADVYIPLGNETDVAQAVLREIPTFVLAYLVSGSDDAWKTALKTLEGAKQRLNRIKELAYSNDAIPSALADKMITEIDIYEKTVHRAHSNNELFLEKRTEVLLAGRGAGAQIEELKKIMLRRYEAAA